MGGGISSEEEESAAAAGRVLVEDSSSHVDRKKRHCEGIFVQKFDVENYKTLKYCFVPVFNQ